MALGMTVQELLTRMTAAEELEWEVLEEVDPWGQRREDHRFALLCATVMNAAGWRKPGGRIFTESDFMLDFLPRFVASPRQSVKTMEAELRAWIKSSNAMFSEMTYGV